MYKGTIDNVLPYELWVDSEVVFEISKTTLLKFFSIKELIVSSSIREWLNSCVPNIKLVLVLVDKKEDKYKAHRVTKEYFGEVRKFKSVDEMRLSLLNEKRVVHLVTTEKLIWVHKAVMLDTSCNYSGFSSSDNRRGRIGRRKARDINSAKRQARRSATNLRRRFRS
jgi:hypothetical protein